MSERLITIVGCGPGSADYLTPVARVAAEQAEVLVGARRLLDLFSEARAERVPVGAEIEPVLDRIDALARAGRRVAVLVTGDPGLCSIAQPVIRRFGREACEVIPGVSSVQVAFARLGLDWRDAHIVSVHGREPDAGPEALRETSKIAVLPGGEKSWPWIARLAEALRGSHRVFLCENLTLPDERVRELGAEPTGRGASLAIVLFIRNELLQ